MKFVGDAGGSYDGGARAEAVRVTLKVGIYQRMIAAYRHPDPAAGCELTVKLIESLSASVPGRWSRSPSSAAS